MTDKDKEKRGGWTQWIIFIVMGVLILAVVVGIFMMWRKMTAHDKEVTELRAKAVAQEKEVLEIRKKADKMGKRLKEMPATSFAKPVGGNRSTPSCIGNSCEMGIEDA